MTRIHTTRGAGFNGQVDLTRYVYSCPACPWQVQAGYRARSDLGGARELFVALAEAQRDHTLEAGHSESDGPTTVDPDGREHHLTGKTQGGLIAQRLPEWWVDRG